MSTIRYLQLHNSMKVVLYYKEKLLICLTVPPTPNFEGSNDGIDEIFSEMIGTLPFLSPERLEGD